jgi:hypothetical protein
VADDSGARLESARESGLPVAGGGGPSAGSGGEARALESNGDERTSGAALAGSERYGDSVVEREREEGKGEGSERGGATRHGGAMGPGPDWWMAPGSSPSMALEGDVRHARVPVGQSGGERELAGGPRHSAGRRCR